MRTARSSALSLLAALLPLAAWADPVPTCHCFTNRTFDAAAPAAADPYILATTRSSLLSATLGPPKGLLVRSVMSGSDPDSLWIAYWAGAREGRPAERLIEERVARGSWKAALEGAGNLGPEFARAFARGATDRELAALAVDDVLATRLRADRSAIGALRSAGASSEEVIVATLVAARSGAAAAQVFQRVHSGGASWGIALRDAGLSPQQIDAALRALVK